MNASKGHISTCLERKENLWAVSMHRRDYEVLLRSCLHFVSRAKCNNCRIKLCRWHISQLVKLYNFYSSYICMPLVVSFYIYIYNQCKKRFWGSCNNWNNRNLYNGDDDFSVISNYVNGMAFPFSNDDLLCRPDNEIKKETRFHSFVL